MLDVTQYDPEHAACKDGHRTLRKIMKLEEKANAALSSSKWEDAVKFLSDLNIVDKDHKVLRVPVLVKVRVLNREKVTDNRCRVD